MSLGFVRPGGAPCTALAACVLALGLPASAAAWGQNGHRALAEIAERHLDPAARAAIGELLDGRGLSEISTWADDIRSYPEWHCADPFHYVTVAPGAPYPDQGVPEGDAVQAIVYYADVLSEGGAGVEARRRALKWLVHLVGDLHQPLHSGRGCDEGGNWIQVEWFGEATNLHSVWDSKLIDSEQLSFTELADFADHASTEHVAVYQSSTPLDWVREAQSLLDDVYTCRTGDRCPCFCGGCEDGRSAFGGCRVREECELMAAGPVRLKYHYRSWALPVIHDQLARGGARLAGMLRWIFSGEEPPEDYRRLRETFLALPEWPEAAAALEACGGNS